MPNSASSQTLRGFVVSLLTGFTLLTPARMLAATDDWPRITVLYDAFGRSGGMQKDWGYAAFIEYAGKRILFDTGNNPTILVHNAKAAHVDLAKLDFVVVSHRHGDHIGGLAYVLKVNPGVKNLCAKGGIWGLRRGLARKLLPAGYNPFSRPALFRRLTTGSHALRISLAHCESSACE